MRSFKRFLCLSMILVMLMGLALPGHALGYQLSGTVTSFGDAAAEISLWLTPEGADTPVYEAYLTGSDSGYSMTDLQPGSYTLTASKEGHVTRVYEVTLGSDSQTLDVKLCPPGDVTGDGKINVADVSIVYSHCKGTSLLTDSYKLSCADYNGNGKVNVADTSAVYSTARGTNRPTVKKVTVTVWAPSADFGANSWLLRMEDAFQKAHPEYEINWENSAFHEGDAGHYVAEDPEAAGDVYMFANDQLGTLINANAIVPISGKYLDQIQEDNSQAMVNTVTYTDDQVYGFPISNNTWFMYYNKDIFSEEDVKSLDTMLTKGTVAFPWSNGWYAGTFFLANGGILFGDKGNDASAGIQFGPDNGGCEAALKMIQLAANPNFINDVDGLGAAGLKTGEIGAFFSGSWDADHLRDALGDKLGAVQLPTVEINGEQKQLKAFAGSKAVGVNPNADEPELAMAFAAFLSTAEAQKLRYEHSGFIPAAKSLADDPTISADPVAVAEINTLTHAAVVQPTIPEMSCYWTPVATFGTQVADGEINEDNYPARVDELMAQLNNSSENGDPEEPGQSEDPDVPEDPDVLLPPTEGGIPVTLKVWAPIEDQRQSKSWLIRMENSFRNAHPEYSITWINGACHEGDALTTISNDPEAAADVYLFANDQLGSLVQAGALLQIEGQHLNQVLEDNSQTLVNTVTHTDDQVYGFPISNNTWFMYYNKDIFSEEDVKSLDTMLAKGIVAFPLSNGWYNASFFLANGGTLFGTKGNDASAGIQFGQNNGGYGAASKMVQLAAHPNFVDDVNGIGASGLKTGQIGAFFSGSWEVSALRLALGDKLGAVQLPTVEIGGHQRQMKAFAGSKAVGVNPNADNTQLAMEFAAFLATPESQKLRYDCRGVIPAAKALANDPDISQDQIAKAEIDTMTNTAVVQPSIPEMGSYWGPAGNFGALVASGEINAGNYREYVDQMMAELGSGGADTGSFNLTGIEYKNVIPHSSITLRVHYHRPDGNYDDWNLWLWDASVPECEALEPPYLFEEENGEMVCTVTVKPGTSKLGYLVRLGDWKDKDVAEDQFIGLAGILSGTVDVYIESGVKGHTVVLNEDVWTCTAVETAGYSANDGQLYVRMSSALSGKITATLTGSDGNINVTQVKQVNTYLYFTFDEALTAGSYTLRFSDYTIRFDIL